MSDFLQLALVVAILLAVVLWLFTSIPVYRQRAIV